MMGLGDFIPNVELLNPSRKYLGYNLGILKRLREPTTVYDLVKMGYRHSSAYKILQKYLRQGLIKPVKTEKVAYGIGYKKYYSLTTLGQNLLDLLQKAYNNNTKS